MKTSGARRLRSGDRGAGAVLLALWTVGCADTVATATDAGDTRRDVGAAAVDVPTVPGDTVMPTDGGGALVDAGSPSPFDAGIAPTGDAGPPTDAGAPAGEGVDLLFVVDNSNSMRDNQAQLARQFEVLISQLVSPPDRNMDGLPDWPPVRSLHVGVISSDLGTPGRWCPRAPTATRATTACSTRFVTARRFVRTSRGRPRRRASAPRGV
jgi:hypothetical protein